MSRHLPERFLAIDALRGIAALAVVIYHLQGPVYEISPGWLPAWLQGLADRGYLGVEIFFVISGFVIAYSVRGGSHTPRYLRLFTLRRVLRLDPPYWVTIALELALIHVGLRLIPTLGTKTPDAVELGANLLYVQNLTGVGDFLVVFWTLAYEVQFYLFFVACLVAWQTLGQRVPENLRRRLPRVFFAALFVVSLLVRYFPGAPQRAGLAIERWFQFFTGALTLWVVIGAVSAAWLCACWLVIIGFVLSPLAPWEAASVVYVSAAIVALAQTGHLGSALGGRVLQYLGRQSYSLYLLHMPIGWRVITALRMVLPERLSPGGAALVLLAGTTASIAAAEVMWRWVERPSMRLSKRIRLPQKAGERVVSAPSGLTLAHPAG